VFDDIIAIIDTLTHVNRDCANFTAPAPVVAFFLGQATRTTLCPALRYLSPSPLLYRPSHALVGWVSLDPDPEGNNCADSAQDWLCAGLGLGYVLLLVLAALLLLVRACAFACTPRRLFTVGSRTCGVTIPIMRWSKSSGLPSPGLRLPPI